MKNKSKLLLAIGFVSLSILPCFSNSLDVSANGVDYPNNSDVDLVYNACPFSSFEFGISDGTSLFLIDFEPQYTTYYNTSNGFVNSTSIDNGSNSLTIIDTYLSGGFYGAYKTIIGEYTFSQPYTYQIKAYVNNVVVDASSLFGSLNTRGSELTLPDTLLFDTVHYSGIVYTGLNQNFNELPISRDIYDVRSFGVYESISNLDINFATSRYIYFFRLEITASFSGSLSRLRYRYQYIDDPLGLQTFVQWYNIGGSSQTFSISSFLTNSVGGFFNFQLLPGITIGGLFTIVVGLGLLVAILKIFMGG